MKFEIDWPNGLDFVELGMDAEARQWFARAAEQIRTLRADPQAQDALARGVLQTADHIEAGLDAVEKLAYVPSQTLHLRPEEVLHATEAVGLLSIRSSPSPQEVMENTLCHFLLGEAVPIAVPCAGLPSGKSLWGEMAVPDPVRAAYDALHQHRREEKWVIPLATGAHLLTALMACPTPDPAVAALRRRLEEATLLWRDAQARMAGQRRDRA